MKFAIAIVALATGASAFAPLQSAPSSTALFNGPVLGAGGMADTRDPDALVHEDARKSIADAPSFEEYLKSRGDGAAAAAPVAAAPVAAAAAPAAYAPAPVAAAPAAYAPPAAAAPAGGGSVVDTLATMEGPGQVWGDLGIAEGHEESDFKGFDNFSKFYNALQSTGVAAEIAGAGPYTIFAPTDTALTTYEMFGNTIDANVVKMHIVPGLISSADVPSADLTSLAGPLTYRYAVRKHFVNDAQIGEKTFGPFSDFPIDVACSNGVIHAVGLCFAM